MQSSSPRCGMFGLPGKSAATLGSTVPCVPCDPSSVGMDTGDIGCVRMGTLAVDPKSVGRDTGDASSVGRETGGPSSVGEVAGSSGSGRETGRPSLGVMNPAGCTS